MSEHVIVVENLQKTFRHGFTRKRVDALRGVTFRVAKGSIFGFLGPNGAGKTTTIKILTGLIRSTAGRATLMQRPVPSPEAMSHIGFLPENPYVYPYLTPREFVTLCGRLSGMSGKELARQTERVLDRVGILYAADRPVQRLSKGMLQRACFASALVADPDLLILDEPMSGLDPVGRKEFHDIILEERDRGKTVFFSSHILSDVESMCDRVTILRKGKVAVEGRIDELLERQTLLTDIVVSGTGTRAGSFVSSVEALEGVSVSISGATIRVVAKGDAAVQGVLRAALDANLRIDEVMPRRQTLEELFVRRAFGDDNDAEGDSPSDAESTEQVVV